MQRDERKKRAELRSQQLPQCTHVQCQDLDLGLARGPKQRVNLARDLKLALLRKVHERKESSNPSGKLVRREKRLLRQNLSMARLMNLIMKIPCRASGVTMRSRS